MRPSSSQSDGAGIPAGDGAGEVGATRYFVQSLERGLAVMVALSARGRGQTLSEVARETGLPRAAVRRFLLTLEELGYVRSEDRRFSLTPRVLELGYAYLSSLSLPEIVQPHLRSLVGRVDESCSLSVLDGNDIVYVAREPTRRIMSVTISIGTRFPAYATSMGRAILSGLPEPELRRFLAGAQLLPLTSRTLTDPDKLVREISRVRRQGWALVDQELENGLRSIAAPVREPGGNVLAAVNVSTHASRTTLEAVRGTLLPRLLETVAAIERDLAARPAIVSPQRIGAS
jgi:IclR family pca regulon transcriptional regulator